MSSPRSRRAVVGVLVGIGLWSLLFVNAAFRRAAWDLTDLGHARRYWEDTTIAVVNSQLGVGCGFPRDAQAFGWIGARIKTRLERLLPAAAAGNGLRPWQPWRTAPLRRFTNVVPLRARGGEDQGRAWISTCAFSLLGGAAPYFPLWLGVLLALPLFLWIAVEGQASGHGLAAGIFLAGTALSTYVAEQLTLPYSTVGLYLIGLLLVVALAQHALLVESPTWRGFIVRWCVAGLLFALVAVCRGSVQAFVPTLALIALAATARLTHGAASGRWWRVAGGTLVAIALLLAPYRVVRPPYEHAFWMGMWEGLGDFDREKGFCWSDRKARAALRDEGHVFEGTIEPSPTHEQEVLWKRLFFEAITSDPTWYARILLQRGVATVFQPKLWPRESATGRSFAPREAPNEGMIMTYYGFTRTADWFGLGPLSVEVPLPVLWLPLVALGAGLALRRARRAIGGRRLAVVALCALAAAALPVLGTTASAPEMQAFVLIHLLLGAFLVEALVVSLLVRGRPSPASTDG